ncbi:MAG: septation protein A [Bauldia sp.]|uniref:septation protein A n=1 Tax=Bauldia sp. TaxID=2575872 RepID=UPI001DC08EE1|nr:septation protein A [Bauldia sp.]MCB1497186.1 septation protein A [Bauldia sp.]
MEIEHAPNQTDREPLNPILKLALELGPLGVFFFANSRGEWLAEKVPALGSLGGPIFIATALFIVATLIALAVSLILTRRLPIMPLVTGIVVVIFGGLTLWWQNDDFIKMKPTIVNVLFGAALLVGLAFGKSLLGYVFDSVFRLTDEGWKKLTFRWAMFFFFLAVANLAVWAITDATMEDQAATDMWVNFKVFGIMPITFVFTLFQLPLINRYALPEKGAEN